MKRSLYLLSALIALLLAGFASAATVGTVNLNSSTTAIYGTGNPNGGWTSATAPNAIVEVRFKERFASNIGSTIGTGVYTFPATGLEINMEFSVGTFNGDDLADYTYIVNLDTDPGPGQTFISYNVFLHNDNSYGDGGFGGTANGAGVEGTAATYAATSSLAQNSQKIQWINPAFNSSIPGTYDIVLSATPVNGGPPVAVTEGQLQVGAPVPEPGSMTMLGLASLGLMRRKRTNQ